MTKQVEIFYKHGKVKRRNLLEDIYMSMRKKGFIVGSTVALMMVLIGCVTNEKSESIDTGSEKNYSEPKLNLSFGTMPATDALPILVASQEGYFVDEGVTVDIQNFKSPKDRDMALRNSSS